MNVVSAWGVLLWGDWSGNTTRGVVNQVGAVEIAALIAFVISFLMQVCVMQVNKSFRSSASYWGR